MQILVAEDDELFREIIIGFLERLGHRCLPVDNGQTAWEALQRAGADVVISDWHMPVLTGLDLCMKVRADPDIAYPYFILLTAHGKRHDILTALRAGVDDHLTKSPNLEELEARLIVAARVRGLHLEIVESRRALQAVNETLHQAAHHDPLTGLGNRLRMSEDLPGVHARFERLGQGYSIGLFDIDHFKAYNDTHGHQAGDRLLAEVGRVIACEIRTGDTAYRYGGEELLVVFAGQSLDAATVAVERIRAAVAAVTATADVAAPATVSAGVAEVRPGQAFDAVIRRADLALYDAKRSGRNRVSARSNQ